MRNLVRPLSADRWGWPTRTAREPLDQFGSRLQCVVAAKTFRDAAAMAPRLVAHQKGERADRLLRLCIVAFMKQKVEYAEAVLRYIEEWRRSTGVSAMITNNAHEEPIATSLAQIMENLCTIAVASLLSYRFQC